MLGWFHFFRFQGLRGHCLVVRYGQCVVQPSFCLEVDRWAPRLQVSLSAPSFWLCGPVLFSVLSKSSVASWETIVPNISSAIKECLHPQVTREKQGTLLTESTGVSFVAALLLNNHFIQLWDLSMAFSSEHPLSTLLFPLGSQTHCSALGSSWNFTSIWPCTFMFILKFPPFAPFLFFPRGRKHLPNTSPILKILDPPLFPTFSRILFYYSYFLSLEFSIPPSAQAPAPCLTHTSAGHPVKHHFLS